MKNIEEKKVINELSRVKELMYGKELLTEQWQVALRSLATDTIRTIVKNITDDIAKAIKAGRNIAKMSVSDIITAANKQWSSVLSKLQSKGLKRVEISAARAEFDNLINKEAQNAAKTVNQTIDDAGKKAGQLVKTGGDDAGKTVKTAGGDASKSTVKTAGGDASKKTVTNTGSQSKGTLKYPPVLVKKGADVTDNAGNVIVKNGQVTDLTPAIVKSESGVPKLAPGMTDDAAKPYLRQYLNAFDEPTASAATGAAKKGSTLVGKMTEGAKNLLIKSGILKNVGGKLTISWKRVLLYSVLFGVGYAVVANWFKDNGVTPVKDPSDPIVNQDPSIVDPTLSGSQGSGTSGSVNTVVSKSPSGQNRYTFDFAAVMTALNDTGKCPTGYGTSGTAGTAGTSGTNGTSGIITEPDTTLSSDDYYEYMSS